MPDSTTNPPHRLPPDAELLLRGTPAVILSRIADGDPLHLRARVAAALERRCLLLDADRCLLLAFAEVARCAARWGGRPALGRWLGERVGLAVDQAMAEEARVLGDWSAQAPGTPAPWQGTVAEPQAAYDPDLEGGPDADPPAQLPQALPPVDGEHAALVLPPACDPAGVPAGGAVPGPDLAAGRGLSAVPVLAALARPLGLDAQGLRRACAAFNARPEAERRAFDALVLGRQTLDEVAKSLRCSGSAVGRRARRVLDAILAAVLALPGEGLLPSGSDAAPQAPASHPNSSPRP